MTRGALILCIACQASEPTPPESDAQPARQFHAETLAIREMRAGKIVWNGTARQAQGDINAIDVADVQVTRAPQTPNERPLHIVAPRATLAFDTGQATFMDVHLRDNDGLEITTPRADYDERRNTIAAVGPVRMAGQGLNAIATAAVIDLNATRIDLAGPIEGRWMP